MAQPTQPTRAAPKHAEWLDPLNKLIWVAAFKVRATEMTLRDGREFTIHYSVRKVRTLDIRKAGPTEMAWVKPKYGGLAPCGHFRVDEVLDPGWNRPRDDGRE